MGEEPSTNINVIMGDRALRLAFKLLVEILVRRRGLTSQEGQEIFDVINRETEIEKEKAAAAKKRFPTVGKGPDALTPAQPTLPATPEENTDVQNTPGEQPNTDTENQNAA